ncbi:MAG: lipocalin family protein [Chitinophagaceae bacterium]
MLQLISRSLVPLFAGIILLGSCSSSKKTESTVSRSALKGTWTLNRISYEGLAASEKLRLTLLDEGNETCLTGSTWVFPNNGYGSYTISKNSTGCVPGQKNIIWSYRTEADQTFLQYKKLEGGVKAKDITDGYKFKILSASSGSLELQSEISYEGKPVYINYSFSKS